MRIRTITTAATIAALSTVGFASTALALPDSTVPGHADREYGDRISTHYNGPHTNESYADSCDLVMNANGEAATWDGMADGHMMNRIKCNDGSVVTYHIFHETHPAYTGERDVIWGSWEYFATTNKAGR